MVIQDQNRREENVSERVFRVPPVNEDVFASGAQPTAKKLRGTKVWVPTPRAQSKAGLGVGCERVSPPSRCEGQGVLPPENF